MHIFRTIAQLEEYYKTHQDITIGFVPTMGALHKGHISLVKKSVEENQLTVCSIFVNPTQFNNKEDLEKYPRNEKHDILLLKHAKCNVAFIPAVEDMYAEKEKLLKFDLKGLDATMEGKFRKGHFAGVITIVNKLFNIVKPNRAYFGEKDFQQLIIIKYMAQKLHKKVEVIGCPTFREEDNLAMSSRNARLTPDDRKHAPTIYKAMYYGRTHKHDWDFKHIKEEVVERINAYKKFKVDYFEIVEAKTLKPAKGVKKDVQLRACIAVQTSTVRLIDNIIF